LVAATRAKSAMLRTHNVMGDPSSKLKEIKAQKKLQAQSSKLKRRDRRIGAWNVELRWSFEL